MRAHTRSAILILVTGIAMLFGAVLVGALIEAPAGAAPGDAPQSGDPRATAFAGNAVTCADAGLPGEIITDVEATIDATGTFVTITSVPDDIELTGVVVKGGAAYNVYVGDVRDDLHAPLNSSGSPAQVSHWYACGTPTTGSSPSETPSSPSETTPSSPGETTPSSPGGTTSPAAAPSSLQPGLQPASPPALAETGAPVAAMAGLGVLLVAVGAAMLAVSSSRRRHLAGKG